MVRLIFSFFSFKTVFFYFVFLFLFFDTPIVAQGANTALNIDMDSLTNREGFSSSISLVILMDLITIIPFFFVTATSFLRIVIVLSMLRQAMATQQAPPNMALIGLAMFMTIFVMTPSINTVLETSIKPYQAGAITQQEAIDNGIKPFREFMLRFTRDTDLALFLEFSKVQYTDNFDEVPIFVIMIYIRKKWLVV